jgi:hypothetical protein
MKAQGFLDRLLKTAQQGIGIDAAIVPRRR